MFCFERDCEKHFRVLSEPIQKKLYAIKNFDVLEKMGELASVQTQIKVLRLQDKLGKQNFHGDMKKAFEPVFKTVKDTFQDVTKTMIVTCTENSKIFSD